MILASDGERFITVGTPAWFAWLESAAAFAFTSPAGSFTARKETRARGGWYWKAYHTAQGTLHRAYLGKTSDLTLERLETIAATLAAAPAATGPSGGLPGPTSTDGASISLLSTKLIPPPARAQLVTRMRLFERVEAGLQGKLTLIAAPAGFGKTTLLSAWRSTTAGSAIPFAWVSLDSADNDPLLFWNYVLAAIDGVAPGAGMPALALLQSPQPLPIDYILTSMLNTFTAQIAGTPGLNVALVLEDYHVITNPAIHTALGKLLDGLPPQLHMVIITRADPALPLTRSRASGDLTELHADDLRLTPEEVASFLNRIMGLELTPDDLSALEARTEGWIAGLQLAALALRDHRDPTTFIRTFSGSNRYIVDYLAAEVFERQPANVQNFLLQTAILDRMCAPLCDAVLNTPASGYEYGVSKGLPEQAASDSTVFSNRSSQSMLEELERANLFVVPLDEDRHWYRYHHLFADVLRQRLTRSATGAAIVSLHERASAWYEQQGLAAEAVQHALMEPDGLRAAALIEQHGLNTIVSGQVQTALGWLSRLPQDLLRVRPLLSTFYALALLFTSDLEGAEARLQDAERCVGPDTTPADARIIQGYAAAMRANIAVSTGDLAGCADYGEQVLRLLPETEVIARTMAQLHIARAFRVTGDVTLASERRAAAALAPIRASGNLLGLLGAVINLARLQELQGRLRQAAATYRELVQIATGQEVLQGLHGSLPYYVGMGDLHREWNEVDAAEGYLTRAIQMQPGTGTVDAEYVTLGYIALARLQQARGEHAAAQETLIAFMHLVRRRGFASHLVTRAEAVKAHLALKAGNLPAAVAWAEASGLHADDVISFAREAEYLVLARVWVARASDVPDSHLFEQTVHLLDRLMEDAAEKARHDSVLEILIVRSITLWCEGNQADAITTLVRALTLAAPEGYVRRFVDEGPTMQALLRVVDSQAVMPGYVHLLLAAFVNEQGAGTAEQHKSISGVTSPSPHHAPYEPLSERELEVLRLIAMGQSNVEVARALVIALSTVKTHTNTIFGKLGVTSRTQAVARARDLRLL
ncbi:MAG: LuxR C-terminal-related transcriptional regulator [Chloroflexota bacterium]